MMSLWDALRMNMMISYQELVRTFLIVRYKFIDAVEEKSGDARWHFGVIAQDVEKAFSEEGLNASDYGLFCYDEWEDQYETIPAEVIYHPAIMSSLVSPDGEPMMVEEEKWEVIKPAEKVLVKEAGGRYGIRYEELLAFIIAAL
ncbi:tail fiber domain-containing protein [Escherichia coli]|nr:tail fiber domain-containing protein [Escherichia coli]